MWLLSSSTLVGTCVSLSIEALISLVKSLYFSADSLGRRSLMIFRHLLGLGINAARSRLRSTCAKGETEWTSKVKDTTFCKYRGADLQYPKRHIVLYGFVSQQLIHGCQEVTSKVVQRVMPCPGCSLHVVCVDL